MGAMSSAITEKARKNERAVLTALSRLSQTRVAELMGISDSGVTRMKEGSIEQVCTLLAACGLRVVSEDMQCFSREKVHALLTLARDHLVQMEQPEELSWE